MKKPIILSLMIVSSFFALNAMQEQPSTAAQRALLLFRMKDALLVSNAAKGNVDTALALLNVESINVNVKDGSGMTALHYAAQQGLEKLVPRLLEKGADITLTNSAGQTAAQLATDKGFTIIAELLKHQGT